MDDHEILLRNNDRLLLEVDLLNNQILSLKRLLRAADTRIQILKVELEHITGRDYSDR